MTPTATEGRDYRRQAAVRLLAGRWRPELDRLVGDARRSLLFAAPYIKSDEAERVCASVAPGVEMLTLANLDVGAVSAAALDIEALVRLAQATARARAVALSNLHAKVYVADGDTAIVTSGNLTRAGLDSNLEYGVLLREPETVHSVRNDLMAFARLGAEADAGALSALLPLEAELRRSRAGLEGGAGAKRRFARAVRKARPVFGELQVGERSAHAVFAGAILMSLRRAGPAPTKALQEEARRLLPALCDDDEVLVIRGERYGSTWKRRFRHAQLHLSRKGLIEYDRAARTWAVTDARRPERTPSAARDFSSPAVSGGPGSTGRRRLRGRPPARRDRVR